MWLSASAVKLFFATHYDMHRLFCGTNGDFQYTMFLQKVANCDYVRNN